MSTKWSWFSVKVSVLNLYWTSTYVAHSKYLMCTVQERKSHEIDMIELDDKQTWKKCRIRQPYHACSLCSSMPSRDWNRMQYQYWAVCCCWISLRHAVMCIDHDGMTICLLLALSLPWMMMMMSWWWFHVQQTSPGPDMMMFCILMTINSIHSLTWPWSCFYDSICKSISDIHVGVVHLDDHQVQRHRLGRCDIYNNSYTYLFDYLLRLRISSCTLVHVNGVAISFWIGRFLVHALEWLKRIVILVGCSYRQRRNVMCFFFKSQDM